MINRPSEFVPTVNQTVEPPAEKHYVTFTNEELADLLKIPGIDTVTFTPDEWNYFAEELRNNIPIIAFRRAKYLVKTVNPPRSFDAPQYPFVPCGDKSPGIDDVDLTPEEWTYFVEEVQTKSPFVAFNNAKYLFKLDRSFSDMQSGKGTVLSFDELEEMVNG